MTIKSLQSTSLTNNIFYRSMLAGNDAFAPDADDFLEEVVLTSSASSVTFSGLASYATAGYKHLQIRALTRSTRTGYDSDTLFYRYNGNSGSNYSFHGIRGTGSSVSSFAGASQTEGNVGDTSTNLSPSSVFGSVIIDILDFSSAVKATTTRAFAGFNSSSTKHTQVTSGGYYLTEAITSIEFFIGSGDSVAGSRFSLYGSKA
jgi:hypothetical protein